MSDSVFQRGYKFLVYFQKYYNREKYTEKYFF